MPLTAQQYERLLVACTVSDTDRRSMSRTQISLKLTMHCTVPTEAGKDVEVQIIDLSAEGFGLISTVAIAGGQRVTAELPMAGQQPIQLTAEIRHCRIQPNGTYKVGARFVDESTN